MAKSMWSGPGRHGASVTAPDRPGLSHPIPRRAKAPPRPRPAAPPPRLRHCLRPPLPPRSPAAP